MTIAKGDANFGSKYLATQRKTFRPLRNTLDDLLPNSYLFTPFGQENIAASTDNHKIDMISLFLQFELDGHSGTHTRGVQGVQDHLYQAYQAPFLGT